MNQLKADRVPHNDLGLIHLYLNRVGGTNGTYDYSIMRMFQNLSSQKLIDIGLALMNVGQLDDERNIMRFLNKVESYIILTH